MSEGYRVQLEVFTGPLDLLLYLIRRDELDIQDIPIARLTEQYLAYVHVLEQIDPNAAGEFLVMASTLVELKSRALLPTPPLEPMEDDASDPRTTLVRQLLEYKRFKDAAEELRRAGEERAQRFPRSPANLPKELQGIELEEAQVWDLLEAFGRVMTAIGRGPTQHQVQYDETPIELYQAEIVALLGEGVATFQSLFDGQSTRGEVIGRFLAILELVRSGRVRAEQDRNFGTIYLFLADPREPEGEVEPGPELAEPAPDAAPSAGEAGLSANDARPSDGEADLTASEARLSASEAGLTTSGAPPSASQAAPRTSEARLEATAHEADSAESDSADADVPGLEPAEEAACAAESPETPPAPEQSLAVSDRMSPAAESCETCSTEHSNEPDQSTLEGP
ncbi:MAG TPA: segregation/condensation protein A [Phycisphaerae bacterium]|jgi:segregation and condensation protein A|nr:segregation/condensation protein A [Phycisphaerae bacterium]HPC21881.1 segregation/condensation protein A [Phycisphaerae bacterium]HRS27732.1 segregation/condensation protein A [Phycisphaerae bacterium]HRT42374.1 segregation/condensation protein A [Phycisphaerae bacterium]